MDNWETVLDFPGYSVSDTGRVRNDRSGRELAQVTTRGGVFVGLWRDNAQHNRMVARLVAEIFLEPPAYPYSRIIFDTPINKDGNRRNNDVSNLLWRPRWFAYKFHQQFKQTWIDDLHLQDVASGQRFNGVLSVGREFGLLAMEVYLGALAFTQYGEGGAVWPTGQHFLITKKPYNKSPLLRGL